MIKKTRYLASLFVLGLLSVNSSVQAKPVNPNTHYVLDGQSVSPWAAALGDESEWFQAAPKAEAISAKKALYMKQITDDGKQAINLKWKSKKKDGAFYLTGESIDLSALKDGIAIALELKVNSKIRSPLTLSMDCTYPCRGSLNLKPILDAYPKKEWITLPIPLRCFAQAGTDLSKVNSPLHIQSKGKLDLSIASARLIQIPDDFPLCKEK